MWDGWIEEGHSEEMSSTWRAGFGKTHIPDLVSTYGTCKAGVQIICPEGSEDQVSINSPSWHSGWVLGWGRGGLKAGKEL